MSKHIIDQLEERGLIQQITDEENLRNHLTEEQVTLYCGFDPTADSLHIGHLLPVTILRRFQDNGHKPIALIGGGTGMIGDPSGRSIERSLNTPDVVMGYAKSLENQLENLLKFDQGKNAAVARNNHDWLNDTTIIDFLRDTGKHFSVNYMLAKDSVSTRLEQGITFTEFSYMLLQSFDYQKLYEEENCTLQIGGSDQWGNITAGMELIRRNRDLEKEEEIKVFGLTVPLITKADGTKFGKTAGGAIWLDSKKTTPYEFYQFWLNTDDRDAIKFLKYFTFIPIEEILKIQEEFEQAPETRIAQKRLAEEMTIFVHSKEALKQAIHISESLFNGNLKDLTKEEIVQEFKAVPTVVVDSQEISLVELLVNAEISSSKRQAREDITNGAIYINGERIKKVDYIMKKEDRIENYCTIIRRGKKKYTMIQYK